MLPEYEGQQMTVRRIQVHLYEPNRDNEVEVVLLTNLPREDADAIAVSELYRTRWKIETAFGHMTVAMNCEIKTLCYPKAALFCFASALMAYNAFAITKERSLQNVVARKPKCCRIITWPRKLPEATDGMLVALPDERWAEVETVSTADFANEVRSIISGIDMDRYRKSNVVRRSRHQNRTNKRNSVHVSTKRILDKRRENAC